MAGPKAWSTGLAWLARGSAWRGSELTPVLEWGEDEQLAWLASVKLELKLVKERMQGEVRKQRKEAIKWYIKKTPCALRCGQPGWELW